MTDNDVLVNMLVAYDRAETWVEPYFDVAEENYKLYRQYRDASDYPYVNSIFTPDTFAAIENIGAKVVQTFWSTDPVYSVQPRYTDDEEEFIFRKELARQMERGLSWYINDEEAEFYVEAEEFIKSGCIHGNGYLELLPRVRFIRGQSVFDGLQFTCKDFWSIIPDPRARRINARARRIFSRDLIYIDDIQAMMDAELIAKRPIEDFMKGSAQTNKEDDHQRLLREIGVEDYDPPDKDLVELITMYGNGEAVVLANRAFIVRDTERNMPRKGISKPHIYGIPVIDFKYIPVPREFFGLGIPEIVKALQEDTNLLKSQRRENIDLILNKVIKFKQGRGLDIDLFDFFPGARWPINEQDDVEEFQLADVTTSSYREEEMNRMGMEQATGDYRYSHGQEPLRRETGVGIVRLQQAAAPRNDVLNKRTELHSFRAIAKRSIAYIHEYENPERWERIIGEADLGFFQIPLEDILEQFAFIPMGASVTAVKEQRASQKMAGHQMLMRTPPELQQMGGFRVDYYEAMMLGLESLDLGAKERFIHRIQQQQQGQPQMGMGEVPIEALMQAIGGEQGIA